MTQLQKALEVLARSLDPRGLVLTNSPCPYFSQKKLPLSHPFQSFLDTQDIPQCALGQLSNHLPMVLLRKAFHRALSLLPIHGSFLYLAHDPDPFLKAWPGEWVTPQQGPPEIFRPLRQHVELARLFGARLRIPKIAHQPYLLMDVIKEEALQSPKETHSKENTKLQERSDLKYGPQSTYRRFHRLEEPEILDDLLYAVHTMKLRPHDVVLGLGSNDGREFELFHETGQNQVRFIGLDSSPKATQQARQRFPAKEHSFLSLDLNELAKHELPKVHAVLLLNVLQCTTVDRDRLLSNLLPLLHQRVSILISVPNNHPLQRDIGRRPLSRKDPRHDRSLVTKDLRYLTRFLYRAGFQTVENFGTYDSFLLAHRRQAK